MLSVSATGEWSSVKCDHRRVLWQGGHDAALRGWIAEPPEDMQYRLSWQFLWFLRPPEGRSDIRATPPRVTAPLALLLR